MDNLNKQFCNVCDISSLGLITISGDSAKLFIKTMYSGNIERLTENFGVSQGFFLSGDSEIIDLSTIVHTGGSEYLIFSHPSNTSELNDWLNAHAELSDKNGKIFNNILIENKSKESAKFLIYGLSAKQILETVDELSSNTHAYFYFSLDNCDYAIIEHPCYCLITSSIFSKEFSTFFSEKDKTNIIGIDEYKNLIIKNNKFIDKIYLDKYFKPNELNTQEYIRKGDDFVGYKSLL